MSIVCIQSLLSDFFFPSFCIISENFQGTRRGPELLVKNILFYCGMQDALFFHLVVAFYPRDGHNSVSACAYLQVSEHESYFENVKR